MARTATATIIRRTVNRTRGSHMGRSWKVSSILQAWQHYGRRTLTSAGEKGSPDLITRVGGNGTEDLSTSFAIGSCDRAVSPAKIEAVTPRINHLMAGLQSERGILER